MNTPVLLLTGYLGSGKTTLLNRILSNRRGIRFAVIVNDIGEVNIDASLIREGGVVGQDPDAPDLVALQNGCICCSLRTDLMKQIVELSESGLFDYIVIEASGICEPAPIAQSICAIPRILDPSGTRHVDAPVLDCIVTVVDALRLAAEFGCGDALTASSVGDEDIERLIIEQIEFCNIIILNKISEVTPDQAAHIRAIIRTLQPKAEIIECDYGDIPLDSILHTGLFDFEKVATSPTWVRELENIIDDEEENHHHHHDEEDDEHGHHHHHHHHHHAHSEEAEEYGIGSFVYFSRRPFSFARFDHWLATAWPREVIRAKGVIYFGHNRDMSILFEQAGPQKKITEAGHWYATAPADELEILMQRDPGLARDWDPVYGDRMNKIVFIGRHLDPQAISSALDSCLEKE